MRLCVNHPNEDGGGDCWKILQQTQDQGTLEEMEPLASSEY